MLTPEDWHDPDDREQVERLASLLWPHYDSGSPAHLHKADVTARALREFANPTPPKPPEPTALAAVVEDRNGIRWTRVESAADTFSRNPWYPAAEDDIQPAEWHEIDAVTVLSEGVKP